MDRRGFVKGAAAAAAGASLAGLRPAAAAGAGPAGATAGATAGAAGAAGRLVVDGLDTSILNEGFLRLLRAGGASCVHKSMGDATSYAHAYAFLARHREEIVPVVSVREIRRAHAEGRLSILFGVQHANLLERLVEKTATGTTTSITAGLRQYHELGVRVHGICYNVANVFGGGCVDPRVPLTRAGRHLVEQIHAHRIVLDVGGHTGEQTSLDAIAASAGVPVVCTHTNVAALNPNYRASSDRLMEAIARTGGVIGITAISDFLVRNPENHRAHGKRSPRAGLDLLLDQFDYMKRLVGVDHVGLGPDFVWGWGESFEHRADVSISFPPEALSDGAAATVEGFADISELPNLIAGLRGRGWTEPELDRLLGENWLRVYERVWGA